MGTCTIPLGIMGSQYITAATIDFAPKTDARNGRLCASMPSTSAIFSLRYDEPERPSRKALALILVPFLPCRITVPSAGLLCQGVARLGVAESFHRWHRL